MQVSALVALIPVGLCTGNSSAVQWLVGFAGAQILKTFPDGFVCNGGDPESLQRLLISGFVKDPACHKFPFSAGIGCNDDIRDIFPENQLFDSVELAAGLFDDYQLPVLWEHGKRIHVPGLVLFVVLLRISQCDKVTQRPCDDIVCSFYISICFFIAV